jgi:Phospholipase B
MRQGVFALFCLMLCAVTVSLLSQGRQTDPRMKDATRSPARNGWTLVHLQGTPAEIGYQHGSLLAAEILEMKGVAELELKHDSKKDWTFFRRAARDMMWPRIEQEYRDELQGIADGVNARGVKLDVWDIVALNGLLEWPYYTKVYDKQHKTKAPGSLVPGDHCSAFVATGTYTKDGKVVIAHNNWTSYIEGVRWTIVFDIVPANGHRILMDGLPGFIHSADDFGINSAGIIITETTITGFEGYDPKGIPEFVRARKAMQYSASIDEFARIMKEGNNGGYANDWLIADRKTNEVASLELGLKNVTLERTTDGYFVGANFPINPKLAAEESTFDMKDLSLSPNARKARWQQLMAENKGTIDVASAERFMADHYDTFLKKTEPSERTLCGHVDLSPRGMGNWQPPFGIAGTVQNKVADATMAEHMSLAVSAGHACGIGFKAADHLKAHPEFGWQKPYLKDMPSGPWTVFEATK